jgi:uncharacterized protein (TIGR04552 family)
MRRDFLEIDTAVCGALYRMDLKLADIEAIRLLLGGGSVVDWQRLAFTVHEDVDRFLATHLIDVSDPRDRERLRYVFNEAVSYLEEHLHLRFPSELRNPEDVRDIFLIASQYGGFRRRQILSCVILKLMHVIQHMEAADLKHKTPIAEERLFDLAEAQILRAARRMREAGLPVVSFYGSRKTRSSIITKLLSKGDCIAATIFDKLRFRIVVEDLGDLVPTLAYLTRNMFPFNHIIPGQSHNNLLEPSTLPAYLRPDHRQSLQHLSFPFLQETGKNELSAKNYRMINYIVDFPVMLPETRPETASLELGRVVYVMAEFQILDAATARTNEEGENAHHLYKERQQQVVARRLKRGGAYGPPKIDPDDPDLGR